MIEISSQFRGLSSKIYLFGFLSLAVSFLELSSVSRSGIKIEIQNSEALAGAFSLLVALLSFAAVFCFVGDFVRTMVKDEDFDVPSSNTLTTKELVADASKTKVFSEKWFPLIRFSDWVSLGVDALVPLIFGICVTLYSWQDMVVFIKEITR